MKFIVEAIIMAVWANAIVVEQVFIAAGNREYGPLHDSTNFLSR